MTYYDTLILPLLIVTGILVYFLIGAVVSFLIWGEDEITDNTLLIMCAFWPIAAVVYLYAFIAVGFWFLVTEIARRIRP